LRACGLSLDRKRESAAAFLLELEVTMKAQDVMVRDVLTVKPDADVADAIKLLAEHDISALPVVDAKGNLVGILSEADLLVRIEDDEHRHRWWVEAMMPAGKPAQEFAKEHGKKVSEVMSTNVVSASEDTPVSEIAAMLERHRIKRVPISPRTEIDEFANRIEQEAEFLARHSDTARVIVNAFKTVDREIRLATDNNVDLKIVLALGIIGVTVLEVGAAAATPVWVTLSLFALNHVIEMHTPQAQAAPAVTPVIVKGASGALA
jgi:CBS domain-containing protein